MGGKRKCLLCFPLHMSIGNSNQNFLGFRCKEDNRKQCYYLSYKTVYLHRCLTEYLQFRKIRNILSKTLIQKHKEGIENNLVEKTQNSNNRVLHESTEFACMQI